MNFAYQGSSDQWGTDNGPGQSAGLRKAFSLRRHVPVLGLGAGLFTAICVFFAPAWVVEQIVVETGIGAFVPAANPPLGMTARIAMTIFIALIATATVWAMFKFLFGLQGKPSKAAERQGSATPVQPYDGRPVPRRNASRSKKRKPLWRRLLSRKPRSAQGDSWLGPVEKTVDRAAPRTRKPIFAGSELGTPMDQFDPAALGWSMDKLLDDSLEGPDALFTDEQEPAVAAPGVFTGDLTQWSAAIPDWAKEAMESPTATDTDIQADRIVLEPVAEKFVPANAADVAAHVPTFVVADPAAPSVSAVTVPVADLMDQPLSSLMARLEQSLQRQSASAPVQGEVQPPHVPSPVMVPTAPTASTDQADIWRTPDARLRDIPAALRQ